MKKNINDWITRDLNIFHLDKVTTIKTLSLARTRSNYNKNNSDLSLITHKTSPKTRQKICKIIPKFSFIHNMESLKHELK
jgi:hypothetical protein